MHHTLIFSKLYQGEAIAASGEKSYKTVTVATFSRPSLLGNIYQHCFCAPVNTCFTAHMTKCDCISAEVKLYHRTTKT